MRAHHGSRFHCWLTDAVDRAWFANAPNDRMPLASHLPHWMRAAVPARRPAPRRTRDLASSCERRAYLHEEKTGRRAYFACADIVAGRCTRRCRRALPARLFCFWLLFFCVVFFCFFVFVGFC